MKNDLAFLSPGQGHRKERVPHKTGRALHCRETAIHSLDSERSAGTIATGDQARVLVQFLEETVEPNPYSRILQKELYLYYRYYCGTQGSSEPYANITFSKTMRRILEDTWGTPIQKKPSQQGNVFLGLQYKKDKLPKAAWVQAEPAPAPPPDPQAQLVKEIEAIINEENAPDVIRLRVQETVNKFLKYPAPKRPENL